MIPENIVQAFIQKISLIKQGQFNDFVSRTRDVFDARLMSYTSRTQNWLLSAVIGEIGANTFDHNFSFSSDVPKGVFCDFDSDYIYICDFGAGLKFVISSVVENKWNLFYQSGNAVCNADETGYTFGTSSYNHDGCFCILSCKEN